MTNKEKLLNYYDNLFDILNNSGFRQKNKLNNTESKYYLEAEELRLNHTQLTDDPLAFSFLIDKGEIREDICHFCGESPIDGSFKFTEPFHQLKVNICQNCYTKGRVNQGKSVNLPSKKSGCMPIILVILLLSVFVRLLILN